MKKFLKFSFAFLLLAVLASCSSSEEEKAVHFQLEKPYSEVMQGTALNVFIKNGSGDLQVSASDATKELAEVTYSRTPDEKNYMGVLSIQARKPGEFQLSLTDNITKEQQQLTIKVLPPYLCLFFMGGSRDIWPMAFDDSGLFLFQNEERSFYLCPYSNSRYRHVAPPIDAGTYEIITENGRATLLRLRSKETGAVHSFTLSNEVSESNMEMLTKLGKSELSPDDKLFISSSLFQLEEQNMNVKVAAGIAYKSWQVPEKLTR